MKLPGIAGMLLENGTFVAGPDGQGRIQARYERHIPILKLLCIFTKLWSTIEKRKRRTPKFSTRIRSSDLKLIAEPFEISKTVFNNLKPFQTIGNKLIQKFFPGRS